MPSLTAQCQDIAASARQDDYGPDSPWEGIKPEPDMYIVCRSAVRFEEHCTGELPRRID